MCRMGVGDSRWDNQKHRYRWNSSTVSSILAKPEYAGHTVNFRSVKESYKSKKQTQKPQEKCRTVKRRTDTLGEANPLTGLLYCADCGRRMYQHRQPALTRIKKSSGLPVHLKARSHYRCSSYQIHRGDCTQHYISTPSITSLLLETIRRTTSYARENETEFVRLIREASTLQQTETAKANKRQVTKNEKRIAELDGLFRKTYEDFAAGRLNEKRFEQLSAGYEAEQSELETQTAELKKELAQFEADTFRADKFMELAKRYTDFSELTPAILHEFVEKVIVHEADKSGGNRKQDIDVYLNFIGKFAVPDEYVVDTGEIAPPEVVIDEAKLEEQRAKWREYKRVERAQQKTAQQEPAASLTA